MHNNVFTFWSQNFTTINFFRKVFYEKEKNKQFSDENVCKANLSLAGVRQFD